MKSAYRTLSLLLCLSLLTACSGGSDQDDPQLFDPFIDQIQSGNYHIGYFPLYDYRIDAALLALKQINANGGILGGKPMSLVAINAQTLDNFANTDVLTLAQQMIEQYQIQIIGASSSRFTRQLSAVTVPQQILQVSEAATSPSITNLDDNDWLFRVAPSDIYAAQLLANLVQNRGSQRCVVIYNQDDPYGQGLASAFSQKMQNNGGQVLDQIAIPQDLNIGFSAYFSRLYDPQPDCIFSVLTRSSSTANLINESLSVNFNGYYVFSDAVLAAGFAQSIAQPQQLRGSFALSPGRGRQDNLAYIAFVDAYQAQFGQMPLNYAAHTYDLMLLLALAIEHAAATAHSNQPNTQQIRDSLRLIANAPGIKIASNNISEGLSLARQGIDIDYQGASNRDLAFDQQGDVSGELVYELYEYDENLQSLQRSLQRIINN